MAETIALKNLIQKGQLPTVNVEVALSKESMIDLAATAVIAAIVVVLLNKFLFSRF